jgi:hypothetical protein
MEQVDAAASITSDAISETVRNRESLSKATIPFAQA